jgi:hypothetical protein
MHVNPKLYTKDPPWVRRFECLVISKLSHTYVINVQIFDKKLKMQKNEYISLYSQLDMFS